MQNIQTAPQPEKARACLPHTSRAERLTQAPRHRATRGLLEAAHANFEVKTLLGPVLIRARRRSDRATALAIEAALAAAHDLGVELDQVGTALCQCSVLWDASEAGSGR